MLRNESLKNFIEELIQEVEKELDEANVTGNIDGYQTPHAFSGKNSSNRRKKTATQLGYTLVDNDVENIDESVNEEKVYIDFLNKKKGFKQDRIKFNSYEEAVKWARKNFEKFNPDMIKYESVTEESEGLWANIRAKRARGEKPAPKNSKAYKDAVKAGKEINKNESVNENRWLAIKNDESMHAHKKLAMGLKELKYQLSEVEKFFNWYNKIKNINELESSDYWKRTNNHIYKIKERIVNIARTLKEIEK